MSVPTYPAPAPPPRPQVVTIASYLLFLVAGLELINGVISFAVAAQVPDALRPIYAGTELEGAEGVSAAIYVGGGVISILLAVGLTILSIFNGRGKNASRIITWILGGLALCCLGFGLLGNAAAGVLDTSGTGNGPSEATVQRALDDALPSWLTPVNVVTMVLVLLAMLTVIILLLLPASNEFFRKPAPAAWGPGYPYPGQAFPGQPPYPGQPASPYPGQPAPPYPGPGGVPPYPGQAAPGVPPYPGQAAPGTPSYPGQGGEFGQQGQPGQPAPGLPPYPGQQAPGAPPFPAPSGSPQADPFAPPPSDPYRPPTSDPAPPPSGDPYGPPPASDPYGPPASDPPSPPPSPGSPAGGDGPRPPA